ncbi:MAG: glycosyltransferase family 39 protein [Myxococcales bacterium]|nr:glycosyltransferase family 39 protein [Myxococcales bacterium]
MAGLAPPEAPQVGRVRRVLSRVRSALRSEAPAVAHPRVELVCRVIAVLASLWFTAAVAWEMFGPIAVGHWASNAAIGIAAENMWKWKIIAPVAMYLTDPPTPAVYYCNHPWGIFWTTAIVVKLFGHQDFVCRLPAVVMSALSAPLVYGIGRQLWGPVAGALACLGFVVTPIALAFGNFNNLEVPVMFGVLLATWGYLRMTQTWRRRWILVSAFGFFTALNSDWPGFFFSAVVLAFGLPRGILFNGFWYPSVDRRRFAQWWALGASLAVGLLLFYLVAFQKAGQLGNLLTQGMHRSAGGNMALDAVLESRADWIDASFTPLAIFIGKAALPLFVFRLLFLRKDAEIFPLAMLAMAALQYVTFKQGADIHFFWPQPFALYFAFSLGLFAWTFEAVGRALVRRFGRQGMLWPPAIALLFTACVPIAMFPDGVAGLVQSRRTGGRFDERGDLIHQDVDKITVLKWLRRDLESGTTVMLHDGMKACWSMDWALRRPILVGAVPVGPQVGEAQYFVLDTRFAYATDLTKLADSYAVRAVGAFWIADRSKPKALLDGFSLSQREPTRLEWYFRQGNDPMYTVVPDPFVTWELRHHLKQEPNAVPTGTAKTFEQRRIAHNAAVASGDLALAERLRQELVDELDKSAATDFSGGVRLLGTRMQPGIGGRFSVYFLAPGPIEPDATFNLSAEVTKTRRWTLIDLPTRLRATGMPFEMPTPLWKAGMIYRSESEIRPRPGTEKHNGSWGARRGTPSLPVKPSPGEHTVLTTVW